MDNTMNQPLCKISAQTTIVHKQRVTVYLNRGEHYLCHVKEAYYFGLSNRSYIFIVHIIG